MSGSTRLMSGWKLNEKKKQNPNFSMKSGGSSSFPKTSFQLLSKIMTAYTNVGRNDGFQSKVFQAGCRTVLRLSGRNSLGGQAASRAALTPAPRQPGGARRQRGWGFPTPQLFPACHGASGNCVSQRKVRSVLRSQAAGWILMELSWWLQLRIWPLISIQLLQWIGL